MLTNDEILETINMINKENLDIRTITMGISLIDCMDSDIDKSCKKVYDKIYNKASRLVEFQLLPLRCLLVHQVVIQ